MVYFQFYIKRNRGFYTYEERYQLANNWLCGRYQKFTYFRHTHRKVGKLFLDSENLYVNFGTHLKICKRAYYTPLDCGNYVNVDVYPNKENIIDYSMKGNRIFAITAEGTALIYEINNSYRHDVSSYLFSKWHAVQCTDFYRDIFIIASDDECKVYRHYTNEFGTKFDTTNLFVQSYTKLEMVPNSDKRFVGFKSTVDGDSYIHDVNLEW